MRFLRSVLSMGFFCLLLLVLAILEAAPASSQGPKITPDAPLPADVFQATVTPTVSIESPSSTFQITLAELDYEERILDSPYGTTEYTLRLPEGWELGEGSFFDLDFSYTYNYIGISETPVLPSLFGKVIVVVDGQTQLIFPINEAKLEHSHLRIDLPLPLLNDPARSTHSIEVTLDAGHICEVPHRARLIIHPTSLFSLAYNQLPVTVDLALYPRPFHQRAFFESDQVRFVLPAQPTEVELAGTVAVAAKLGDLTDRMVISGTTDLELMDRLEALEANETLDEHLIVVGRPESNEVILKLNQLGALPVPLQERQLSLASEGLATVVPGGILTYTLTLINTTQDAVSSLSLVDTLPAYAQVVTCSPSCSEAAEGEVSWSIPSLGIGEALSCTLRLRLSEVITDSVMENTVTLLDAAFGPLNVNTLTTTVRSTPLLEPGLRSSTSSKSRYLFVAGEQAVPENDGVVQELVSPWDQARAILVITGLSDEAVHKASQAMSFESHFPGMKGPFALVREVRPLSKPPPEPQGTELTFADLGYGDKILGGWSQEANYYFDIPVGWRLTEAAYLDLHFSHSQLLNYGSSFLSVLFNRKPIATIALSNETSLNGELKVELPPSQAYPGQSNRISVQTRLHPVDRCLGVDMWLLLSGESLLYLDHKEQKIRSLDLDFYPYPFDQRSDLADVLFVLPSEPRPAEWEETLQVAAALGAAAGGPNLTPAVALGDTWSEAELGDYHLIAVGRPSRNPVLRRVNAQLPQPFLPDSDLIEQKLNEVILRLPPDVSLGCVQLIPLPWNEERGFLALTGTSDKGVAWSVWALVSRLWELEGNLALVRGEEIDTIDTRKLTHGGVGIAVSTAVPELTPVVTTPTPVPSTGTPAGQVTATAALVTHPSGETSPWWLVPLVATAVVIVLAIFAVAIWQARRQPSE